MEYERRWLVDMLRQPLIRRFLQTRRDRPCPDPDPDADANKEACHDVRG